MHMIPKVVKTKEGKEREVECEKRSNKEVEACH